MNVIETLHNEFKARLRRIARKAVLMDKVSEHLLPKSQDELDSPINMARPSILFGLWLVFLVFGVFGLWSVLAKIDSAAIAAGRVVVDTNRKTIDHLEGGIVEEILVSDGMLVEKDQPLIKLREISAKARVDSLKDKYYTSIASEARLQAERNQQPQVDFPKELLDAEQKLPTLELRLTAKDKPLNKEEQTKIKEEIHNAGQIVSILSNQRRIFKTRTETVKGQLDILEKRISKSEEEIKGLDLQSTSMNDQIKLLSEEIAVVEKLVKDGNATRPRLLSLQRQKAELEGRRGEYMSLKAKAMEGIDETRLAMLNTKSEYLNKVEEELKQTQLDLADVQERMTASSDVLDRVIIRAPDKGIVNELAFHTVGGVVKPGQKILDIIPVEDKLIVEARVAPQDIDVVRPGLLARVRLTAYKVRQVPAIDGEVKQVSADQLTDERTGTAYFLARIEIDASKLEDLKDIELYPGMPADVLIITGSRTFLAYMMAPIRDSFNTSFRQQ